MISIKLSNPILKLLPVRALEISLLCGMIVYATAIGQDYLYSEINTTRFFWSETLLYNTYWLWFFPFLYLSIPLYRWIRSRSIAPRLFWTGQYGMVLSLLHLLVFTETFCIISSFVYENPHAFVKNFNGTLAHHGQLTFLTYLIAPYLYGYLSESLKSLKTTSPANYTKTLKLRNGLCLQEIEVDTIEAIVTDKPYSMILCGIHGYLHDYNLKQLEGFLNPAFFLRVHRSVIVNRNHIRSLTSRKNGDYDALLSNGRSVRLSRHYRQHWEALVLHWAKNPLH
jgi:two-component system LytT family response regulator